MSTHAIIFLLLLSSPAVSQKPDSTINDLLRQLTNHDEIDRHQAIKYLHLDSTELQENPAIRSDSSFSFGSHIFWIISYGAVVNCSNKALIEYNEESRIFKNRLLIDTDCDFDLSGDHTTQIHFKIKGNVLYVYNNYYKIRNEDLVLDKKRSTYIAYRLPQLTSIQR